MSFVGDRPGPGELPRQWERLERLAEEAVVVVGYWRRRATEAEREVARLRGALEELASVSTVPGDLREEVRRVRAENAALHSRLAAARGRVEGILKRLAALGVEP
jgi:hypothetical protein